VLREMSLQHQLTRKESIAKFKQEREQQKLNDQKKKLEEKARLGAWYSDISKWEQENQPSHLSQENPKYATIPLKVLDDLFLRISSLEKKENERKNFTDKLSEVETIVNNLTMSISALTLRVNRLENNLLLKKPARLQKNSKLGDQSDHNHSESVCVPNQNQSESINPTTSAETCSSQEPQPVGESSRDKKKSILNGLNNKHLNDGDKKKIAVRGI